MTSKSRADAPRAQDLQQATRRGPSVGAGVYTLVPVTRRFSLDVTARRCGLHPDLIRRLVALGLVDAAHDAEGRLWFGPGAPATLARVQRLRAGLQLNYAAVGLVMHLLDRIGELEAEVRRAETGSRRDESWI
ncbi:MULTISPECIES: chaperone modulator CbpM [unclassified Streptomyces]|uniref:chaperone modulator CbpM n=1 Tax=unclassified Streptomyces TaxID=2593676 RepID=UPI002E14E123|nr:chaperone modulator CbpM [Streptomyces sp. NBC_01197]WSS52991.1 chaperone modulator CbpM [Streptomyces sp. NBC_01180]